MNHIRHMRIHRSVPPITLIGAGGVGSPLSVAISKMGCPEITLFDGDIVSEENIPTQFHPHHLIGQAKVTSVKLMVDLFSDETEVDMWATTVDHFTTPETIVNPIVISAVDTIKARQDIWTVVGRSNALWYIDMRMAAEQINIYIVDLKQDASWYSNYVFGQSDEIVPDLPCTSKATIYCGLMAAGHAANIVKRITMKQPVPRGLVHHIANNILIEINE